MSDDEDARRGLARGARAALFGVLAVAFLFSSAHAAPRRVVSLDHCADEYLLALADRAQIAAVSADAGREFSYYAARADDLKRTSGSAESVLAFEPDLVVRFFGGGYRADEMLARFKVPVLTLEDATTFDGVRVNTRRLGDALGQRGRAERLVAEMDRILAAGEPPVPRRVLYVTPGGVTAGEGTMVSAILAAAGLTNVAVTRGVRGWARFDLEEVVMTPPDVIVASFFDHATARTDHWNLATNAVLRKEMHARPTVILPSRLMTCGAPFSAEAVARIRNAFAAPMGASP